MASQGAVNTSTDQIFEDLRRSIITGHYGPGDRLKMGSLAKEYGTSVTPVREALRMLLQDGLVRVEPHAGYTVARISLKQLDDLLDLRQVLEVAAIERAISRITKDQLEELDAIKNPPEKTGDRSPERFVERSRRFHELIAEASGNRELERLIVNVFDKMARFVDPERPRVAASSAHSRIVKAFQADDTEAAQQAVMDEIRVTRDVLMRRLIEKEGASWYLGEKS